jgi:cytochrome c
VLGTKMAFPGLKDPKQVDDIVAYSNSSILKGGIVPAGRKLAKVQ